MAGTEAGAFDPRLVTVVIADVPIAGLDEGEAIVVERATAESITYKQGIYGDVAVSVSSSSLYILTIKLLALSRSNKHLQDLHDAFMQTKRGWFATNVNDLNDDTKAKFTSPKGVVMSVASFKRGAEAPGNEFKILCTNGKLAHEGMAQVG